MKRRKYFISIGRGEWRMESGIEACFFATAARDSDVENGC